ncbi:hypothetical protein PRIPAC_83230 [Pristionchus pacificus]|uniref:Uncharacterized protein n=1 Tax=Pristionchus pacificus TaxID=54126 RepID=A0A2A6BMH2_PRIPA|nr:hypothetical protein PRIPAC_83230 [Pristionchus pacificus]|eukprot:PDM67109.1 hypothetical protein PRIPAC_48526 [Pristionchus pacificus]
MSKRKRSCYLCSESDIVLRKFPANSKEFAQKQWLDRLGLDGKQTREKLEIYREKIDQGVDIRWCSTHFDSTGSLPKDLRKNPPLRTCELRSQLQPQRLQQRYRTPSVPSTPVESDTDNEIEMDQGLITPPRQDPILHSSPIRFHSVEDYYDDDVTCNESLANLPKRFKTQSSITSDTTIDNGSEYVLSQGTAQESEGGSDESDSEMEEMDEEKREKRVKYRIVGDEQLLALFRRCNIIIVIVFDRVESNRGRMKNRILTGRSNEPLKQLSKFLGGGGGGGGDSSREFRRRASYPLSFEEELHNLLVEALELAHSASDRAQTAIHMARNGLTQLHQHYVVSSRSPPRPPPIPIPYDNFLDDEEDDDEEQGPTATPRGRSGPGTPKAPRKSK